MLDILTAEMFKNNIQESKQNILTVMHDTVSDFYPEDFTLALESALNLGQLCEDFT